MVIAHVYILSSLVGLSQRGSKLVVTRSRAFSGIFVERLAADLLSRKSLLCEGPCIAPTPGPVRTDTHMQPTYKLFVHVRAACPLTRWALAARPRYTCPHRLFVCAHCNRRPHLTVLDGERGFRADSSNQGAALSPSLPGRLPAMPSTSSARPPVYQTCAVRSHLFQVLSSNQRSGRVVIYIVIRRAAGVRWTTVRLRTMHAPAPETRIQTVRRTQHAMAMAVCLDALVPDAPVRPKA